jgi:hypothetical protein
MTGKSVDILNFPRGAGDQGPGENIQQDRISIAARKISKAINR